MLFALVLPVTLAFAASEEDEGAMNDGRCEFAPPDNLAGPVLRTKTYEPPLELTCATYTRKLVIWDNDDQERYFGYVTPDTVCYRDGDLVGCEAIKKGDEVVTIFQRKLSAEARGLLIEVRATSN